MAFSEKAKELLRSVSHQPWGLFGQGLIRVKAPDTCNNLTVCPVCMAADIKVGRWDFYGAAHSATRKVELDLDTQDVEDIICAADCNSDPNRDELIKLLGGIRTRKNYNPVTKEYRP